MKLGRYGIEIFNGMYTKYGGHWQKLSVITGLDYFAIGFCFGFSYFHDWYDGQHHILKLGFIHINWGGKPYLDV